MCASPSLLLPQKHYGSMIVDWTTKMATEWQESRECSQRRYTRRVIHTLREGSGQPQISPCSSEKLTAPTFLFLEFSTW